VAGEEEGMQPKNKIKIDRVLKNHLLNDQRSIAVR
jgi:hypothetical protein